MESQKKSLVYFDNSVIQRMRREVGDPAVLSHHYLLKEILAKYKLAPEQAFFTDKLFIEAAGHGNIRRIVLEKQKANIKIQKQVFKDKILKYQTLSPEEIDNYINFLQNLFLKEFTVIFPQEKAYSFTAKNTKQYSFHQDFYHLRQKIIRYGKNISKDPHKYNTFIATLVTDSIIRNILDFINLRDLPPNTRAFASDSLQQILNALLIKYIRQGIVGSNLILVISGLRSHGRAEYYFKHGANPVGSNQLLRVEDDFADSDMPYFAFHGEIVKGICLPVTVISDERLDTINERLKCHLAGLNAIIANNPKWLKQMKRNPLALMLGRTICVDFNNQSYKEIPSSSFIKYN